MIDIKGLSLEEKIGQMFLIGINEQELTQKTVEMIQKYKVGGIILYRRNYSTYEDMLNLINKIKQINKENKIPIFISIDQEGGRVNRMPKEIHNLKSALSFANTKNIEAVKQSGKIIGKMLNDSGVNLNYGPVLDIKRFEEDHAIGDRCYGINSKDVSKYAIEVMKSMQNENVISAIKHFPGHGSTTQDSHFSIPRIKTKTEELEKEDMSTFEDAIKNGADMIMVGHLIIEDIDKKDPASLSKIIIKKYLKQKNNYKGLIITDDLKMMAIRLRYSMKKATYKAIQGGNDIIMIGLKYNTIKKVIKSTIRYVKKNKINIRRIDESVSKILETKEKYNITDNETKGCNIEKINKEVDELNNLI